MTFRDAVTLIQLSVRVFSTTTPVRISISFLHHCSIMQIFATFKVRKGKKKEKKPTSNNCMLVRITGSLDTVGWLLFQEQLQDKNHLLDTDERRPCFVSFYTVCWEIIMKPWWLSVGAYSFPSESLHLKSLSVFLCTISESDVCVSMIFEGILCFAAQRASTVWPPYRLSVDNVVFIE